MIHFKTYDYLGRTTSRQLEPQLMLSS